MKIFDPSIFEKKRRTNHHLAQIFDTGSVHLDAMAVTITFVVNETTPQEKSVAFLANPSLGSQYASKVLKSTCALDGHLTLEQLSDYEFNCTHHKRNLIAGMLHLQKAEITYCKLILHLKS